MEDKITYGVYWKSKDNKNWHEFSPWFTKYEGAYKTFKELKNNPNCIGAKIIERVETFSDVAEW